MWLEPGTISYVKFTELHGRDTILLLVRTVRVQSYETVRVLIIVCIIRLETVEDSMFHVLLHSSTSVPDSAMRRKNQTVYRLS